jgi:acetyl-CoA carboxylase carboxyltransferase component
MGSKSIGADMAFAWPGAEIAVMGAEGAVSILHRRELEAMARAGKSAKDVAAERERLTEAYRRESIGPDLPVSTGDLDGIIAPEDTRRVLIDSLELLASKDRPADHAKHHDNGPM